MNTADRRAEIINILLVRRRITAKELADEFHVTVRTIQNDIQALSLGFPIYTKQGGDGGILFSFLVPAVFSRLEFSLFFNTLSLSFKRLFQALENNPLCRLSNIFPLSISLWLISFFARILRTSL